MVVRPSLSPLHGAAVMRLSAVTFSRAVANRQLNRLSPTRGGACPPTSRLLHADSTVLATEPTVGSVCAHQDTTYRHRAIMVAWRLFALLIPTVNSRQRTVPLSLSSHLHQAGDAPVESLSRFTSALSRRAQVVLTLRGLETLAEGSLKRSRARTERSGLRQESFRVLTGWDGTDTL